VGNSITVNGEEINLRKSMGNDVIKLNYWSKMVSDRFEEIKNLVGSEEEKEELELDKISMISELGGMCEPMVDFILDLIEDSVCRKGMEKSVEIGGNVYTFESEDGIDRAVKRVNDNFKNGKY